MKNQMKNFKKHISIAAIGTTGLLASAAVMADVTQVSPGQQFDVQTQVSSDRSQQIRNQLDRIGNGETSLPEDYVAASRNLINAVEQGLMQFDHDVYEILSRFESLVQEYNEVNSSDLEDQPKALRLNVLIRQMNTLKPQANRDYIAAIRRVFGLVPGLPVHAQGSLQVSDPRRSQIAQYRCAEGTGAIHKAVFENATGEALLTAYQCVRDHSHFEMLPTLAPTGDQVKRAFKEQILSPLLAQSCQTDVCKSLLTLDYAQLLQQLSVRIDQPQVIQFGRDSFQSAITLNAPSLSTWMVGENLLTSALSEDCQGQAAPSILPLEAFLNIGPSGGVEKFRSRSDSLMPTRFHFLHVIPILGEPFYKGLHTPSVTGETARQRYEAEARNSPEWRGNQMRRTLARCNETLDEDYGGNRTLYSCEPRGWRRPGQRPGDDRLAVSRLRPRERYYVELVRRNTTVVANPPANSELFGLTFDKYLEASRTCQAHN